MITRTSNYQTTANFITDMFKQRNDIGRIRDQISSGLRVSEPGDDPSTAATISQFRSTLLRLDGHKTRISSAEAVLGQQEAALESGADLMIRLKEIATQSGSETMSSETRAMLAEEVFEIRDALVGLANSRYQGRYIYGGADDDDPPFDAMPAGYTNPAAPDPAHERYLFDAEQGTSDTRTVQISDDDSIRMNTVGTIFSEAISTAERLGRALKGYRTVPEDYSAAPDGTGAAFVFPQEFTDQTAAILGTIDHLESARQTFDRERSDVGARMNRLTQARQIIERVLEQTEVTRSEMQDADIIEAASNLSNLETGLQALLATGARINSLSLLNFL